LAYSETGDLYECKITGDKWFIHEFINHNVFGESHYMTFSERHILKTREKLWTNVFLSNKR